MFQSSISEVCKYDVSGSYIFNGERFSHRGRLTYFSDGKLVGGVRHYHDKGSVDSLFVGIHCKEHGDLLFMELPPFDSGYLPIFGSFVSETLRREEETPQGDFVGFWGVKRGLHVIEPLRRVLTEGMESSDLLLRTPPSVFIRTYFRDSELKKFEINANRNSRRGRLKFS